MTSIEVLPNESVTGEAALEVTDLSVTFPGGDGPDIHAVRGVSYSVRRGEVLAIVGESGSGKSVTSLAVMGLLPSNAKATGSVKLGGHELLGRDDRDLSKLRGKQMSMIFQEPLSALTPVYTIGQQVIEALIDQYPSLARRRKTAAGALSGGEQAMLSLARALVSEPGFILLDEPSAGLSPAMVMETLERITTLTRKGIGILMVEQNIREAMPIADKIYILAAGEKRFEGSPKDVRDDRQIMDIYMGGA